MSAGDNRGRVGRNYTHTWFLLTLEGIMAGFYASIYLTLTLRIKIY